MKRKSLNVFILVVCFLLSGLTLLAQSQNQTKDYYNRTSIAIYKCQKEILRSNSNDFDSVYKSLLKYQLEASHYYNTQNYNLALVFTSFCRNKCLELLPKLNITNTSFFQNTNEENDLIQKANLPRSLPDSKLTPEEIKNISTLDVKIPDATYLLIKKLN